MTCDKIAATAIFAKGSFSGGTGGRRDAGRDTGKVGRFAPLREPTFRRIRTTTSLFSNFGQLILGVWAAWVMTRLSASPQVVALSAGAVADMFDRRQIALSGLGLSIVSASARTAIAVPD